MKKSSSELRQDLVSGDWMVVAEKRVKRPHPISRSIKQCPFENPQKNGNGEPLLIYYQGKKWSTQVIKNKFPIFGPNECPQKAKEGPYNLMDGSGFHEIIITRDHDKHLALLPVKKIEEVLRAYQERYLALMGHKCINYVFIFHNHGAEAGASLYHPHSQLVALPILPADVKRSLNGARNFHDKHNKCVHCQMIKWEKAERRCVFQNDNFIVFAPFVPRVNFELGIYPKKHQPHFEKITEAERRDLAEALKQALFRLYKGLKNPAYNFYIHTAPCDEGSYGYYHWHIEILPKTNIWGGIELGTGVEVITAKPEEVAKFLRNIKTR